MVQGDLAVTKRNAGDGHVQGVSLRGRMGLFDDFWVEGSLSWTDGPPAGSAHACNAQRRRAPSSRRPSVRAAGTRPSQIRCAGQLQSLAPKPA